MRIRASLAEIRGELLETLAGLKVTDLDWSPRPDLKMKSFKQILQEVGAMEKVCCHMAVHHEVADWSAIWQSLELDSTEALLAGLTDIRAETNAYLDACTEEQLQTPVSLNAEWQGYFGAPSVEPEEIMRWIVRHEYYHLGQILIYQWERGCNPYPRA